MLSKYLSHNQASMQTTMLASRGLGCGCSVVSQPEKESIVPYIYTVICGPSHPHHQAVHVRLAGAFLLGNRLDGVGLNGEPQPLGLTVVVLLESPHSTRASDPSQCCSDLFSSGTLC